MASLKPRHLLRAEGLAVFVAALSAYFALDGPVWMLLVLALAPDLSMLGYLAGPRVGSVTYNVAHTYVLPIALAGTGAWVDAPLAIQVAAVWAAHIGVDRSLGYGLKYPSGFADTHLDARAGRSATGPVDAR